MFAAQRREAFTYNRALARTFHYDANLYFKRNLNLNFLKDVSIGILRLLSDIGDIFKVLKPFKSYDDFTDSLDH